MELSSQAPKTTSSALQNKNKLNGSKCSGFPNHLVEEAQMQNKENTEIEKPSFEMCTSLNDFRKDRFRLWDWLWQFEFTLKPPSLRLGMLSHRGGRKGVNGCAAALQPPKLSMTFSDGEAGAVFSPTGQNHPSLVSLSFQNVWVQHCQVKSY